MAKAGETVTLSFTASETLLGLPTVTIAGNAADAVTDLGGDSYEATRVMQAGDPEGPVAFTIDFSDAAGIAGAQVTAVSDGTIVIYDETAPTLDPVSIESDNTVTTVAKAGETVTLSFTANEPLLGLPAVTLDGNAADSVTDLGGNSYIATRMMQAGDTEGTVAFSIDFTDAAGNPGLQVTAVTDATSVTYDETPPAGYGVAFDQTAVTAANQTAISFTFSGAETGAAYFYSIDDTDGATAPVTGIGTIATAGDQVTGIDLSAFAEGTLTLTVSLTDPAGNLGSEVTDTVTKDTGPKLLFLGTVDSDGDGYIDRLSAIFDEPVNDSTLSAASFSADPGDIINVADDGTPLDAEIWIGLTDGVLASDALPLLSIASGGIENLAGSPNDTIIGFSSTDTASPVIWDAIGSIGTNDLTVVFSEPVDTSNIGAGNLTVADFVYIDGNGVGATGIVSMGSDADGTDASVTITSDFLFVSQDTGTDAIEAALNQIFDLADNPAGVAPVTLTTIDITPPTLSVLTTRDVNSDGYIDRLEAAFSEPVDAGSINRAKFSLSLGKVSGVVDDGVPMDTGVWIELIDGELATDALPRLTVSTGGIQDLAGNPNDHISQFSSVDGAAPAVLTVLTIVGERSVYLAFSEPVLSGGSALSVTDFGFSHASNTFSSVLFLDQDGSAVKEVFIVLSKAITYDDIFAPETITIAPVSIADAAGNMLPGMVLPLSEVALGVIEPVWASDGSLVDIETGSNTVRRFDGTETLQPADITLEVFNSTPYPVQIVYEIEPLNGVTPRSVTKPASKTGPSIEVKTIAGPVTVRGNLLDFVLPLSDVKTASTVEFMFVVGGVEAKRVLNPKDPRSISLWTLTVQPITRQRGGVTILRNVIDPRLGEETRVVYTLDNPGRVVVLVTDAGGGVVDIIDRKNLSAGEYYSSWDGKNRAGQDVAPGIYFIKVVISGEEHIRKVLVVRRNR